MRLQHFEAGKGIHWPLRVVLSTCFRFSVGLLYQSCKYRIFYINLTVFLISFQMVVVSGGWAKSVIYPNCGDVIVSPKMAAKAVLTCRPNSHPFQVIIIFLLALSMHCLPMNFHISFILGWKIALNWNESYKVLINSLALQNLKMYCNHLFLIFSFQLKLQYYMWN